jgi:hypothetical protein
VVLQRTVINAGLIENKGFELSLSGTPVQSNFFTWITNINFATNREHGERTSIPVLMFTS